MAKFNIATRDTLATWLDTVFMPMAVQHVNAKKVLKEQKSENERNRQYQLLENVYTERLGKRDRLQDMIDANATKLTGYKESQNKLPEKDKTLDFFDFIDKENETAQALVSQVGLLNDEISSLNRKKLRVRKLLDMVLPQRATLYCNGMGWIIIM